MSVATQGTVIGTFESPTQAQAAVNELRSLGFTEAQIGVASKSSQSVTGAHTTGEAEENAGEGAATGAAVGLGAGALWGLGILAGVLPAIGPVIAGGTLAAIAASAATGAAAGGLTGALLGMGVSDDDVKYYDSEFSNGRTIVTVDAGTRIGDAQRIMARHGARNRTGTW
ncbi:MAG: hypothetical protein IT423_12395 [Pirellulaceae bacterium]|nr:hypothetical protein [Pirellulaceae bacterium]